MFFPSTSQNNKVRDIVVILYAICIIFLNLLDSTSMLFLHQHGMSTLMTTLRRFKDDHRLVVVAFMTLENLLKSGKIKTHWYM